MNEISQNFGLMEPSLADALVLIENDPSLPKSQKTQWTCSIRRIAAWIERPLEALPARMTSLRHPVGRLNAARVGVSAKTLSNHKSNVKAALNHLSEQGLTEARGTPLAPEWKSLMDGIRDQWARKRVHALFRFASARGLSLQEMTDGVLEAYFQHRTETTFHKVTPSVRRETARAWNACVECVNGFPSILLTVEPLKKRGAGPLPSDYPRSFLDEIEEYLARLARPHRSANGRRRKACKQSTIDTRRREIMAAAGMAVSHGVPIETLVSLRELLKPDTAGKVLDAFWARSGERPRNFEIDLSWKFVSIASEMQCLDDAELEQLREMQYALEHHRQNGLTEKNRKVIRAVLAGDVWTKVICLPDRLMADARKLRTHSPVKAATLAQLAVAIRLLTYAPVRIGNLAGIDLDENLIRPGGPGTPHWLVFSDYDVKNNEELTFPFNAEVSDFIDEYVQDFRPALMRGSNEPHLFPGGKGDGSHKLARTLSDQITKRIDKEIGFRITAHQFRHAAAAIILKNEQGNYELVRRVLGHRNIQTTTNFYVGLETMDASKHYGEMIAARSSKPEDKE